MGKALGMDIFQWSLAGVSAEQGTEIFVRNAAEFGQHGHGYGRAEILSYVFQCRKDTAVLAALKILLFPVGDQS